MSRQPQRHRSRELRKARERDARAPALAASLLPPATPRGKGIPVIICGHTLSDIARATNLDQSYLSRLSLGKATPSLQVARLLQAYLELDSIDQVLGVLTGWRGEAGAAGAAGPAGVSNVTGKGTSR